METTKKYQATIHVLHDNFHGIDVCPEVNVRVTYDDMSGEYLGTVSVAHMPVLVVGGIDGSYDWDWLLLDSGTTHFSGFLTTQRDLVGLLLWHLGEVTEDDYAWFQDHLGQDDETEAFEELTSQSRSEGHGVIELVVAVEAILAQAEADRND